MKKKTIKKENTNKKIGKIALTERCVFYVRKNREEKAIEEFKRSLSEEK